MVGGIRVAATSCLLLTSCAQAEKARFEAQPGQEAIVRDGRPAIVSKLKNSVVIVRPASRQFQAGQRPVYVVAVYNLARSPIQFDASRIAIAQQFSDGARGLKVYSFDELASEERTRQTFRAIGAGIGAVGNSMQAANAGRYEANATVYGRGTPYDVKISGYDPTAAAIAQSNAAARNEAMIAGVIETGRRNMDALEASTLKDHTLMPGEWHGGQIQFDPPHGDKGKALQMSVQVGSDVHGIVIVHERLSS